MIKNPKEENPSVVEILRQLECYPQLDSCIDHVNRYKANDFGGENHRGVQRLPWEAVRFMDVRLVNNHSWSYTVTSNLPSMAWLEISSAEHGSFSTLALYAFSSFVAKQIHPITWLHKLLLMTIAIFFFLMVSCVFFQRGVLEVYNLVCDCFPDVQANNESELFEAAILLRKPIMNFEDFV